MIFGCAVLSLAPNARADGLSAHRDLGVSWQVYKSRAQKQSLGEGLRFPYQGPMPVDVAVAYGQATLPHPTAWESRQILQQRFEQARDLRFFHDYSHPDFPRRSSWLYPDDGCYARTALAIKIFMQMAAPVPKKVFVFGDLTVTTPNSPDGKVGWWYHVAPIVEVEGENWVLDPAMEPNQPLRLTEWLARMSESPNDLKVAICESGTYTPYNLCALPTDGVEAGATNDQQDFMRPEWRRLLELERNPNLELGEHPPWSPKH